MDTLQDLANAVNHALRKFHLPEHTIEEIRQYVGSMRLIALENGVYVDNDKPLPIGKEVWLYHGRHFTIGNTSFTYVEKDN